MENNIFQVIHESHLDEIFRDNPQILILIMYSSKLCTPCKTYKPKFVDLSKANKDVMFIYVDNTKYTITDDKYFKTCDVVPMFLFYFGNNKIAWIQGVNEKKILTIMGDLKNKINQKKQEFMKQKNADTELLEKKNCYDQ